MMEKTKLKIVIVIISLLITPFIVSFYYFNFEEQLQNDNLLYHNSFDEEDQNEENNYIYPKNAGIVDPFFIDGNQGLADAKIAGNCSGSGTFTDPYIFSDLIIDGNGDNCIYIYNTNKFVIIDDCVLFGASAWDISGIRLEDCQNVNITDCVIYDISVGIYLDNSNNSNIINGQYTNHRYTGIKIYNSYDILISSNYFADNTGGAWSVGLVIDLSQNIIIIGNNFTNIEGTNIVLYQSHYNLIMENNLTNSQMGDGLEVRLSTFNNISNNFITNNPQHGINFYSQSHNNTIIRNIIQNSQYGIYIFDGISLDNKFYLNEISGNSNAEVLCVAESINSWDNGFVGNYWGDYSGNDLDPEDGIGDTSYSINGCPGIYDNWPIIYRLFYDQDDDGLTNFEEYNYYLTNVINNDTDNDGLTDGQEVLIYGTNPINATGDLDNDGLTDAQEILTYGTEHDNATGDLDNDGLTDAQEILTYGTEYNNAAGDLDNDGLTDVQEILIYGTEHDNATGDFDNDGLTDSQEILTYGTEYDNANGDFDNDGLTDSEEVNRYFTDPLNNDTDNDGFSDGDEINIYHTDPLVPNNEDDTPLYKEPWFWSAIGATGTLGFGIFGYIRKMKKTPKGAIKKLSPKLKRKNRKSKKP